MRLVVTCMKNEGPFVLEWIAYNQSIGFDKFLIYTNDCTDGTDVMADRLAEIGLGLRLDNPRVGGQRPQAAAMRDLIAQPIVKHAEWVFFSDCDEFLNIHVGKGSLDDLFAVDPSAQAFSVMWRLFGDSGIVEFKDEPVIEQFEFAGPSSRPVSVNSWGFKTLFRMTENVERVGPHRPFYRDEDRMHGHWLRSDGKWMEPDLIKSGWRFTRGNGGYELAQINHYAVRSVDSFLVKCARGHVLHTHKDIDIQYHAEMNHNAVRDGSIRRRLPRFRAALARLKADPVLADLHAEAVARHRQSAAALRVAMNDLFGALRGKAEAFRALREAHSAPE